MKSTGRKIGVVAFTLAAVLGLTVLLTRPKPEAPLPSPNGYVEFINAGALIPADSANWKSVSKTELQAMVATNQAALDLVYRGLNQECRVVPYSLTATTNNHMAELAGSKRIAQAFGAASLLALLQGRTNDAVVTALACLRYGQELARGGVIIDGLVGAAVQAAGLSALDDALPGLDAAAAQQTAMELEDLANNGEPPAAVLRRETDWMRRGRFGTGNLFLRLASPWLNRKVRATAEQKLSLAVTNLRKAAIRCAARAYEQAEGHPPTSVEQLVPQYLQTRPVDAATGKALELH
ncbi:MAG TPA: hypothetical protein VFV96_17215 [Verrucomicrobiae bacterium]|nr:hypothetical protein [Verrucomicrobiae bacterium]